MSTTYRKQAAKVDARTKHQVPAQPLLERRVIDEGSERLHHRSPGVPLKTMSR